MTDRSKQIICDPNAVARCLDPKMAALLSSHTTFTIDEISQRINPSLEKLLSTEILNMIFRGVNPGNCDFSKIVAEINQIINPLVFSLSTDQLNILNEKIRTDSRYGSSDFIKAIFFETISIKNNVNSVANILTEGTSVSLLQPEGKGWQKGKLKICFEFIPEEPESIVTQKTPVETHRSPLDEIRQLANELASVGSIEQN
jgi:hypothetical protein